MKYSIQATETLHPSTLFRRSRVIHSHPFHIHLHLMCDLVRGSLALFAVAFSFIVCLLGVRVHVDGVPLYGANTRKHHSSVHTQPDGYMGSLCECVSGGSESTWLAIHYILRSRAHTQTHTRTTIHSRMSNGHCIFVRADCSLSLSLPRFLYGLYI